MTQFTVQGVEYLGVSLPEGANTFILENPTTEPDTLLFWSDEEGNNDNVCGLPRGNYEIVSLVKDLGFDTMCEWNIKDHGLTDNQLIIKKI
jgi:hypothetical protein